MKFWKETFGSGGTVSFHVFLVLSVAFFSCSLLSQPRIWCFKRWNALSCKVLPVQVFSGNHFSSAKFRLNLLFKVIYFCFQKNRILGRAAENTEVFVVAVIVDSRLTLTPVPTGACVLVWPRPWWAPLFSKMQHWVICMSDSLWHTLMLKSVRMKDTTLWQSNYCLCCVHLCSFSQVRNAFFLNRYTK